MQHHLWLLVLLILAVGVSRESLAQEQAAARESKYNVLFIISDDLRAESSPYTDRLVQTPNLDRLAAWGTRFEQAYAQYPLCSPSRTSFLTGRYPTTTGVLDNEVWFRAANPGVVTLPQHFKANGYATLRSGKIFHGGMDDAIAWTEGGEPRSFTGPRRPPRRGGGPSRAAQSDRIVVLEGEGESHGDYETATRAIEYLEAYQDEPFFLAVGFSKPHSPPTAPQKFFDRYDIGEIPLPPDFDTSPAAPPGFPEASIRRRNADLFIGRDASPDEAREVIRAYWASTSFMDAQVGRVLDALERLDLRDNTIVVFFGDHGYHLGEKGKWSKAYSLYEVGLHVPLLIAVPGGPAQASTRPVELVDLFPTLIELCGLPRLGGLEGQSLAPLLRDPDAAWSHPALAVTLFEGKLGRSARTERWHYAEWDGGAAGAMLFDHAKDPRELQNLAGDPAYAETVQAMKRLLAPLPAVVDGSASTEKPTVFLIGDSTVRNGSGKGEGGLWGWGAFLSEFFDTTKVEIRNRALGGRSSRTYLTEGLWDKVVASLKPGDYVLMQFGHNDGGPLNTGRARASLKGNGEGTKEVVMEATGKNEVVRTYGWYLRKYIADAKARGATPIVLSLVPRNIWKDGRVVRASEDYGKWAAEAARQGGAYFIDLNEIVARHYEAAGPEKVDAVYFLEDHTHTTETGARLNAAAVVEGIRGIPDLPLNKYLADAAEDIGRK